MHYNICASRYIVHDKTIACKIFKCYIHVGHDKNLQDKRVLLLSLVLKKGDNNNNNTDS